MSNLKYLEIDSTYRNRSQYPNPADFVVFLSQSGTKNALNSSDPISAEAPQKIWSPDAYVAPVGTIQQNMVNNLGQFIVCYPVNSVSTVTDYYVGTSISVVTVPVSTGVITDWRFLSTDGILDCFIISITPVLSGTIGAVQTGGQVVNFLQGTNLVSPPAVFIPNGIGADNYYVDCIIYNQNLNQWRPIVSYNGTNKLAGLNISQPYGPLTGWTTAHTFVLRKMAPQEFGSLTILTTTTVQLPSTSSNTVGVYIGSFLRFTSGVNQNRIYVISNYTGNDIITPRVATVNGILLNSPGAQTYEILQFTRDNEVQLMYTGSTVSQQEMVCYEIELIDLVLPNKTLNNGGKTAFYPYVYVELQNVSAPGSSYTNIIYSNNPNSTRKLFRCPIDDIRDPFIVPFIKIDSDGTKQTIKFKPNDNLHFAVYLPNGKLFQTLYPETYSPDTPNPFVQISSLFSLKRLS